ncbi:MAG: hypothetical protein GVY13_09175 [Alphaproteobacteria bacterium]|jgi:hypothetical protein|nr:hypothetical protein [Alphaproteobacteria bacterium]
MTVSTADRVLDFYLNFSPQRDTRSEHRRGTEHGQQNRPGSDQDDFSTYEVQKINEAKTAVEIYWRRIKEEQENAVARIRNKEQDYEEKYTNGKIFLLNRRNGQLNSIENNYGGESGNYRSLQDKYNQKSEEYNSIAVDVGRPLIRHLYTASFLPFLSWYLLLMTLLAIIETPINWWSVGTIFSEESWVLTLISAIMAGIILIFIAHFVGMFFRQVRERFRNESRWGKIVWILVIVAIIGLALAIIIVLAAMRQDALELTGIGGAGQRTLFDTPATAPGFVTAPGNESFFGLFRSDAPGLFLFMINSGVFLVAAILSYFRHDPHPDYERAHDDMENAEKELQKLSEEYQNRIFDIEDQYRKQMRQVETLGNRLSAEIAESKEKANMLQDHVQKTLAIILGVLIQQLSVYQTANEEARTTASPRYFGAGGKDKLRQHILSDWGPTIGPEAAEYVR